MNGFIVIDKPEGVTSHDVVHSVRKLLGCKKVGHTGTLDPFATGVLPVALGEATKAIPFLDEKIKVYQAVMQLGIVTDTQDGTGRTLREGRFDHLSENDLRLAVREFMGTIEQVPPMFSALKHSGVPLYRLAREGKDIKREPREITIHALEIEKIELPLISFTVRCSRGTYVRTLANDIGEKLGCGAHLRTLRRIASGPFTIGESVSLAELQSRKAVGDLSGTIISPQRSLSHLTEIDLSEKGAERLRNGAIPDADCFVRLPGSNLPVGEKVILSFRQKLLAVAENLATPWRDDGKNLRLLRVFN